MARKKTKMTDEEKVIHNEIIELFENTENKSRCIEYATRFVNKRFNTLKNQWLSKGAGYKIPPKKLLEIKEILERYIEKEKLAREIFNT